MRLGQELTDGTYQPRAYQVFEIQDPKVRKICSSAFRDRVVHHAVCAVLEPFLERRLITDTYACRKGKGLHVALKRCQSFAKKNEYYLKCDIQKFFESVDHEILKQLLRKVIKDPLLLQLLDKIIDHPIPGNALGKGISIGNLSSQYFANFYLGELDHFLKDKLRVKGYIRYMDDFLTFGETKDLQKVLCEIRVFLAQDLKLQLKEKVTRVAPVHEGIPFLGMRVFRNLIRIQRPNLVRFRKKVKQLEFYERSGKISELELAQRMQSSLAHWSYANSLALRRKEFSGVASGS